MPPSTPTAVAATGGSREAQTLLVKGKQQQAIGDGAAVDTFQAILDRYPGSPVVVEARYRLGESLLDAHRADEALSTLLALVNDQPQEPLAHPAMLLAAGIQRQQGRLAEAVDLYQRYLAQDDLLVGYVQREIAAIQADRQQQTAAIASYQAALAADLPPEYAQSARRSSAELATGLKDYQQAIEWWTRFDQGARYPSEKALAAYSIGLIQKESGASAATATFTSLVQSYPATLYALQALESLLSDGEDIPLTQQGAVYFANRSNGKAIAVYRQYLALYPDGDDAGLAHYYLAILQQRLGNLEQAITAFDDVHRLYPNEAFARDSWLEVARSLASLDRLLEAAAFYEKLAVWYPQSAEAEQALWEASMIYYRLGRPADAARLLGLLHQDFPSSSNLRRTAFWEGKSLMARGDVAEAKNVLNLVAANRRFDYYSLRAQRVLTDTGNEPQVWPKAASVNLTVPPDVAHAERAEFLRWIESWAGSQTQPDIRGDVHLQRALQLQQMRLYDEAATEFSLARSNLSKDPWGLLAYSDYAQELGLPYQAMAAANRILGLSSSAMLDAPRYLQRLLYPIAYGDLLQSMAAEYGVDPLWMASMIRQESGFDRYAYSPADARGLAQVIPSTATGIANVLGIHDFRQEDLFKPLISLRFGAWYLAQELKTTNGNMVLSIAGYNAGLSNAQKWARNQQQLDSDLFVEDITFSETQAYVRLVYEHHYMYTLLWGAQQ